MLPVVRRIAKIPLDSVDHDSVANPSTSEFGFMIVAIQKPNAVKFLAGLLLVVGSAGMINGQNVIRDYVGDRHAQYSPFDHQQRGLVYRMHTGHAGLFGECDDDRQKMISPYIDWHCRKQECSSPGRFVREIFSDMFRKNERLTDGAGACVFGRCQQCNGNSSECNCDSSRHQSMAQRQSIPQRLAPQSQYSNQSRIPQNRSGEYLNQPPRLRQSTETPQLRSASYSSDRRATAYSAQSSKTKFKSIYDQYGEVQKSKTE